MQALRVRDRLRGHRERLGLTSRRAVDDPLLAGDVWIDAAGRIRRVIWTTFPVRRPRAPWRVPRVVVSVWRTTELSVVLYEISGELWRMKRAYDRRQPPSGAAGPK